MSFSKAERESNLQSALKLLMEEVDERAIRITFINPATQNYEGIYETSWIELQDRYLIAKAPIGYVTLTGYGWRTGLKIVGKDNSDTREKLGRICSSLKASVKGRANAGGIAFVSPEGVARETGLEAGFVSNVIDGQLIPELCTALAFRAPVSLG